MTPDILRIRQWCSVVALALLLGGLVAAAPAADLKLQAQLVWGTNDGKSPDPKHKPVDESVRKKLKELPLKWSNYFEVNRVNLSVSPAAAKKVPMSDKCQLEVRSLGGDNVEVCLFGKGEQVVKRKQALPKGEILVLGGNAPNSTAWLVIVKRLE